MKAPTVLVVVLAVLAAASADTFAASRSTSFAVSSIVRSNCIISSASDMAFGLYSPGSGTPIDQTSTIVVRCQAGAPYGIGLSVGTGGGTMAARLLSSATVSTKLEYNLYTTAARDQVWQNPSTTAAAFDNQGGVGAGMGNPNRRTHTVYGRLPDSTLNRGAWAATDYRSVVTVTINY